MRSVAFVTLCLCLLVAGASNAQLTDWVVSPLNGHRYAVATGSFALDSAESLAMSLGGHLLSINDAAENAWVLANVFDSIGLWSAEIGLHQVPGSAEPNGGWEWTSGEPVTYTNWYPGEPNNAGGSEMWATFYGTGSYHYGISNAAGYWNDWQNNSGAVVIEVVPEPYSAMVLLWGLGGVGTAILCRRK